jgi:hypothetical protein
MYLLLVCALLLLLVNSYLTMHTVYAYTTITHYNTQDSIGDGGIDGHDGSVSTGVNDDAAVSTIAHDDTDSVNTKHSTVDTSMAANERDDIGDNTVT